MSTEPSPSNPKYILARCIIILQFSAIVLLLLCYFMPELCLFPGLMEYDLIEYTIVIGSALLLTILAIWLTSSSPQKR